MQAGKQQRPAPLAVLPAFCYHFTVNKELINIRKLWLACIALLLFAGCGAPKPESKEYFAMGTFIEVRVYNTRYAKYIDACFARLSEIENEVSATQANSQVGKLNAAGQGALTGDAREIFRKAVEMADASGGAFDYSVLALQQLWDVQNNDDGTIPPTAEQIAQAARHVGSGQVECTDDGTQLAVNMPAGMGVDLGGIAKGYAGDACAQLLRDNGVDEALINIGGNVRTVGNREFRVGLRDPRRQASDLFAVVTVGETNVITSGDYERYYETDGIRYHHIFNPKTGDIARSGLMSATVIGSDGATADALSTAIFVLGKEDGLALAEREGYEAIVVNEDRQVFTTAGIRDKLEITDERFTLQ